jgi:hypothetical protein
MCGVSDDVRTGVRKLLGNLDRLNRRQALDLVLPALSRDAVAGELHAAGVVGVDAILDWYESWGGQTPGGLLGVMDVLPGFYALSLADALAQRAQHSEWPGRWLPILADGGGDYYVADTSSNAAPIVRHRYDDPGPEPVSDSLATFLATANTAFDQQVIYVSDGYLDQDEEGWRSLLGVE